MKRQASMRSLGQLFMGNAFSKRGDHKPLREPSLDGDEFQGSFGMVGDSSDPLIGKTIDADQTIEDEVRTLLGLSSSISQFSSTTKVKSPLHSSGKSSAEEPGDAGATDAPLTRRSSLPRSNSGDGAGNRYVRKKAPAGAHRQRSMRTRDHASSSDLSKNDVPAGTCDAGTTGGPPPAPDDGAKQQRRGTLSGHHRSIRSSSSDVAAAFDSAGALGELKKEVPDSSQDEAEAKGERRRTLTKIRKSSRRLIVSTNSAMSDGKGSHNDSNGSADFRLALLMEDEEDNHMAKDEAHGSKNRPSESKDVRRVSSRASTGNGSNDIKPRRQGSGINSSGEGTSSRPQSSSKVSEDGDRMVSTTNGSGERTSSRRRSMENSRPSSRRLAEDGDRKVSRTYSSGKAEDEDRKESRTGSSGKGASLPLPQFIQKGSRPSSRRAGEDDADRPSLRDKKSSSRRVNDAGSSDKDGGGDRRPSLRDKKPSSRRFTDAGSSDSDGRPNSRRLSLRDKRPSSRRISETENRRERRRSMVSSDRRPSSSRHVVDQRPDLQKGITQSSRDRKVPALDDFQQQFPATVALEANTNDQQASKAPPSDTLPPPKQRPSLTPSRNKPVDRHEECYDGDRRNSGPTSQQLGIVHHRTLSTAPSEAKSFDNSDPTELDEDDGSFTSDDNDYSSDQNRSRKEEYKQILKAVAAMTETSNPLPTTEAGSNDKVQLSDEPRRNNYVKKKKRSSRISRDSFCEVKLISDIRVQPEKLDVDVTADAETVTSDGPQLATAGTAETNRRDIGLEESIAAERPHSHVESESVELGGSECCDHSLSNHGPGSELLQTASLQSSAESGCALVADDGSHCTKSPSELQPESGGSHAIDEYFSNSPLKLQNESTEIPSGDGSRSSKSPPEIRAESVEIQEEQLEMNPEEFVNNQEARTDPSVANSIEVVSQEKQDSDGNATSVLPDDNSRFVGGTAKGSVASRVQALEAFAGTKIIAGRPRSQTCCESKQSLQDRSSAALSEKSDSVGERPTPDSVFPKAESGHEVENDDHNPREITDQTGKFRPKTRYDAGRSERALLVQSSVPDFLLSPLSATSRSAKQLNEAMQNKLKDDRWAATSPIGPVCVASVAIQNELMMPLQSPHRSDLGLKIDKWASMSPQKPIDVPQLPPRMGSEMIFPALAVNGDAEPDRNPTRWVALASSVRSSMTETQPRRKSLNDGRELVVQSSFDKHTDSSSAGSAEQNVETLKQRLREDRWTPVSPVLPVLPANETSNRWTAGNRSGDADLPASQMERMTKELREERWAPISPMRPTVPVLLKATDCCDALPLTEEELIKSERWAASACNEMKASGHERNRAVSCNEDISMDSFGLIEEDDDDNDARVAARQVALEHSRHEQSIAQLQDANDSLGSSRSFASNDNEDECARMIARKTALEHLIGEHMKTLSQLKDELSQVESRLHILGYVTLEAPETATTTAKVRLPAKSA